MIVKHFFSALCLVGVLGCGVSAVDPPLCGPSNCAGCCLDSTSCLDNADDLYCGFGGGQCIPCSAGQACRSGVCVARSSGGGSGGGTGGGSAGGTGGGSAGGTGGGSAGGTGGGSAGGSGGGTGGGTASTCGSVGNACTIIIGPSRSTSDCCNGLQCIGGRCGTCPSGYQQYCFENNGACWTNGVACSTAVQCSDGAHACFTDALSYSCQAMTCGCHDPSYPTFCAASGSYPDECWSPNIDCSSRGTCPGSTTTHACALGSAYDCASASCKPVIPSWLAGTYAYDGTAPSDYEAITFNTNGTYGFQQRTGTPRVGNFTYNSSTYKVTFTSGSFAGTTDPYLAYSCRVFWNPTINSSVPFAGYRHSEVPQCPIMKWTPQSLCSYVGRYTKTTVSDYVTNGSGGRTDERYSVVLSRDSFYTYDYESSHTQCYNYSCTYGSPSKSATRFGEWTASGAGSWVTLAQLRSGGWSFTPNTSQPCPGP